MNDKSLAVSFDSLTRHARRNWGWWSCLALVACMVAGAAWFGSKDIIFPEIAALAFGAWMLEERPWPGPAWTLWFSPTLGAVTGVLILRYVPVPLSLSVGAAFVLVLLELEWSRSSITPAFSAAVLPIITGIRSWRYPASVCLMAACVAGIAVARERKGSRPAARPRVARRPFSHQAKLAGCVLGIALLALATPWTFIVAPPLLVAFVELAHPDCRWRKRLGRLLCLLTASAAAGALAVGVIAYQWSGPLWLAAALAAGACLILVHVFDVSAPPAFALALLPTILPRAMLPTYPLQVLLGCVLFMLAVRLWFPAATGVEHDCPENRTRDEKIKE